MVIDIWRGGGGGGGGGYSGAVVTHSPPTSEVGGSNPGLCVGKVVVAYQCLQYRTFTNSYVLISSADKTTCHDMTYTVLKAS